MIVEGIDLEKVKIKVLRRYKQAESFRSPLETKWLTYWQLYRSYIETTAEDRKRGRANLFIPEAFTCIETVATRLKQTIFAARPYITALPREETDEHGAKLQEVLLDYQLGDRIQASEKAGRWFRNILLYGMGPAKILWRAETRNVTRRMPMLPNDPTMAPEFANLAGMFGTDVLSRQAMGVVEMVYDDPDIELVDVLDFYWDPTSTLMDNARFVIQKARTTMYDIQEMGKQGVYENVKDVSATRSLDYDTFAAKSDRFTAIGQELLEPDPLEQDVELKEYWGDVTGCLTDKKLDPSEWVVTLANDGTVIRAEPNPFDHKTKPYIAPVAIPDPAQLCGIPLLEAIEKLQYEMNDTHNQRMDNANFAINKMWKVARTADLDESELVSRPNGIIHVDNMEDINEVITSDVKMSSYQEEALLREYIQMATAANNVVRGEQGDKRQTATEIMTLAENSSLRFKDMVSNVEDGVRQAVRLIAKLNQQFLSADRLVRIVGPQGYQFLPVSPEDISGDYDYIMVGSATEPVANKDFRRQQLIQLYQVLGMDPRVRGDLLIRHLLSAFDIKNPDSYLAMPQMPGAAPMGLPGMPPGMPPSPEAMMDQGAAAPGMQTVGPQVGDIMRQVVG